MNYHDIKHCDMLNGSGLRTVLFVSGCSNKCPGCHNPETWDADSGIEFTELSMNEILDSLNNDYISGLTISGGDPFYKQNIDEVLNIVLKVKSLYPNKSIWIYSGYTMEYLYGRDGVSMKILDNIDVLVDGKFIKDLKDSNLHYRGSSNQRVINVHESISSGIIHTIDV
jgi:anaerobic ribonucleoside-triphosphate reductase activating protein